MSERHIDDKSKSDDGNLATLVTTSWPRTRSEDKRRCPTVNSAASQSKRWGVGWKVAPGLTIMMFHIAL